MTFTEVRDETNLPWVEKYRPATLDDLVSHKDITATLTKLVTEKRLPHLLFYGPPGTGKTTSILAIARMMYTAKQLPSMVLELNASDDRGIGIVREQIMNFAQTKTLHVDENGKNRVKLIILDEADAMTKDAQSALRRVIEKFTENVRFCIICNYLSKIIPAIQSRCTRFRFAPLNEDQILPRLRHIIKSESLNVSEDGERALLKLGEGDMRRVLNVLQSTSMAFPDVDENSVYLCVGQPLPSQIEHMVRILLSDSFQDAFTKIEGIRCSNGFAVADVVSSMRDIVLKLDIPSEVTCHVISEMAEIEYRLSQGCTDRMQLAALISAFVNARSAIAKLAPATD